MISVKVDPEAMTRRDEDASDDPLEQGGAGSSSKQNEQSNNPAQDQQKPPRPINSYILKECAEYTVDEVWFKFVQSSNTRTEITTENSTY